MMSQSSGPKERRRCILVKKRTATVNVINTIKATTTGVRYVARTSSAVPAVMETVVVL